jgi:hypothetical protein
LVPNAAAASPTSNDAGCDQKKQLFAQVGAQMVEDNFEASMSAY